MDDLYNNTSLSYGERPSKSIQRKPTHHVLRNMGINSKTDPYQNKEQVVDNEYNKNVYDAPDIKSQDQAVCVNQKPCKENTEASPIIQDLMMDRYKHAGNSYDLQGEGSCPLAITKFIGEDNGTSSIRYLRPVSKEIPKSISDHQHKSSQIGIPIGMEIKPYLYGRIGVPEIPTVNLNNGNPIRCEKCSAYINPYVRFINFGKQYVCNLCHSTNTVPESYYADLDAQGRRIDILSRPELQYGSVDLIVSSEYWTKKPRRPRTCFLVDVSQNAKALGLVVTATHALKSHLISILNAHPFPMEFIFMFYDEKIYFYNFTEIDGKKASRVQIFTSGLQEPFIPLQDEALAVICEPGEYPAHIFELLDQIPAVHANDETTKNQSALGSAIELAGKTISKSGGRIVIFHAGVANTGKGIVTPRSMNVLVDKNNDKKPNPWEVYGYQHDFYKDLGITLAQEGISVDMFVCTNSTNVDLATFSTIVSATGGSLYHYPMYTLDRDYCSVVNDLYWLLVAPYIFDAQARVRVGDGLSVQQHYGNFTMLNSTDIIMARIDSSTTLFVTLQHDSVIKDKMVCFQVAIAYTTMDGIRKVRLHNTHFTVSNELMAIKTCNLDTLVNIMMKYSIEKIQEAILYDVKQNLIQNTTKILEQYRQHSKIPKSTTHLVIPESLKPLPLYLLAIIKNRLFRETQEITIDKRVFLMRYVMNMDSATVSTYLYPELYQIVTNENYEMVVSMLAEIDTYPNQNYCNPMPLSINSLRSDGIYILNTVIGIYIWVGKDVMRQIIEDIFCVSSIETIDTFTKSLPSTGFPLSEQIRGWKLSWEIAYGRGLQTYIVRQDIDALCHEFNGYLIDDSSHVGVDYHSFLCHLHMQLTNYDKH